MKTNTPWYREAFDENYLHLYLHRDLAEAARAVDFLARALGLTRGQRLLDLCCGPGRHLVFLARQVGQAVGLDLSRVLLARARDHLAEFDLLPGEPGEPGEPDAAALQSLPSAGASLIQGDMRALPLAAGSFDRVVNLFTSFGYFEREQDNQRVLNEVARLLRPAARADGERAGAGLFAIDHINREALLAAFSPSSERRLPDGREVREARQWDAAAGRVSKRIVARDLAGNERTWRESVRVYHPEELEAMLRAAGLTPLARHGGYDGRAWSPAAPRLIVIARRA